MSHSGLTTDAGVFAHVLAAVDGTCPETFQSVPSGGLQNRANAYPFPLSDDAHTRSQIRS